MMNASVDVDVDVDVDDRRPFQKEQKTNNKSNKDDDLDSLQQQQHEEEHEEDYSIREEDYDIDWDDDEFDDDDDDDDDEAWWTYLVDKRHWKQHAMAILVALIATVIAGIISSSEDLYFGGITTSSKRKSNNNNKHYNNRKKKKLSRPTFSKRKKKKRQEQQAENILRTSHAHVEEYRRMSLFSFCEEEDNDENEHSTAPPATSSSSSPEAAATLAKHVNRLEEYTVNIPVYLAYILEGHYILDEQPDGTSGGSNLDTWVQLLQQHSNNNSNNNDTSDSNNNNNNIKTTTIQNPNYHCLKNLVAKATTTAGDSDNISSSRPSSPQKSYIRAKSWFFRSPSIDAMVDPRRQQRQQQGQQQHEAASLSFTGFAAKFINLSPEPLQLRWDARGGHQSHRVATVGALESVGTATTPGQSFYVAPLHDSSHALQRWTVTAEDALLVYDVFSSSTSKGRRLVEQLPWEQRVLLDMQRLNLHFSREYLAVTGGRTWLAFFPPTPPAHNMWDAKYFHHLALVKSRQTHFTSLPPEEFNLLQPITKKYYSDKSNNKKNKNSVVVALPEYRHEGTKKNDDNSVNDHDKLLLKLQTISVSPAVFEMQNFLSDTEVQHLLTIVQEGKHNVTLEASTVHAGSSTSSGGTTSSSNEDGSSNINKNNTHTATRSSTNAWIHRETSPIVDAIYRRAADVLQMDESLFRQRDIFDDDYYDDDSEVPPAAHYSSIAEALQVVHYGVGEEYVTHHDFASPSLQKHIHHQPTRFASLLLYLNDDFEGGETVFPRSVNLQYHEGLVVKPVKGKAVLFYNKLRDGNMDDASQHASRPVTKGEKWLANLWVWDPIID